MPYTFDIFEMINSKTISIMEIKSNSSPLSYLSFPTIKKKSESTLNSTFAKIIGKTISQNNI